MTQLQDELQAVRTLAKEINADFIGAISALLAATRALEEIKKNPQHADVIAADALAYIDCVLKEHVK